MKRIIMLLTATLFGVTLFGCNTKNDKELIAQAKQAYLDTYIKNNRKDATIDDVWLFDHIGIYSDSLVGVFLDRKNCYFSEVEHTINIGGLNFVYSEGYDIIVYNPGTFFTLAEAYNKDIISFENLNQIYKVYCK